jgi:hypothetical protein
MFESLTDGLEDAMQALADLLSGFADKVAQVVADFFEFTQWLVEATMDALLNYGVPQSERVELTCGGHVEIDYYVRNPG